MGSPLRESFDPSKKYRLVEWIASRDAQDFSLNELQRLLDLERERLSGSVWKESGIASGLQHTLLTGGQIQLAAGLCHLRGRTEEIEGATLTYPTGTTTGQVTGASGSVPIGVNPTSLGFDAAGTAYLGAGSGALDAFAYTGVDGSGFTGVTGIGQTWASGTKVVKSPVETVFVRWLEDLVTASEDASLISPTTGDVVEERIRVATTLATTSPDSLDEFFEIFNGTLPNNWVLASGASAKGYPPKFGVSCLKLVHTNGTETRIEREIALTPNVPYTVLFWVRTVDGKQDLSSGNGAFVDLQRASPAWNPTDYVFATSQTFTRHAFAVTADGNVEPATIRIVLPSAAPSTEILVDALLVTTSTLTTLQRDRHYFSVLFWDRATDVVTRAVARPSNLRMQDLEPPLSGLDIIDLDLNPGFQDFEAELTFDEHGHYRVPPGLTVERDTALDSGSVLGLRVASGKAYVFGYRVKKPIATSLLLDKAVTTAGVAAEGHSYAFGTYLYGLNKALGLDNFPIEAISALTAEVEEVLSISRGGTPNGTDALGVTNVLSISGVSRGTQGSHAGSATGPFAFDESNNVLRIAASPFAGGAVGAFQVFTFARGSYTIAEVLEALNYGTGRAYRSGKIVGNVLFENDGSGHLRIKTKTQSASSSFQIDTTGNGSTADTLLGLTANTYTGTGTQYVVTTDWTQSGNSISWAPGGAEPTSGQSYSVVVRRTKTMTANTDYRVGGVFPSTATYHYKVTAWGPNGEGLPSAAVNRSTLAGEINRVAWSAIPNAASYHVYRSSDGGSTYNLLKNTVDVFFLDDGSLTPDSAKHPQTVETLLNGALSGGEATITVDSTTGFPTGGTRSAFIEGSDIFTYTGTNATQFTGCSGAVAHLDNATVRMGPDMGLLTLTLDELGVVNWSPAGQDPVDAGVFSVTYTYYQPRIDLVTVDRKGVLRVIKGVPADQPLPPGRSGEQMDLAQIRAEANSATTTINNSAIIDRPLVTDLRLAMARIEVLFANDMNQQIINDIDKRTTAAKKGIFADAMASEDGSDLAHPLYAAALDLGHFFTSVPFTMTQPSLSVNGGNTTAVAIDGLYRLPSSEITLASQLNWSEAFPVNPYAAWTPPPAIIVLNPARFTWTIESGGGTYQKLMNMAILLLAQQQRIVDQEGTFPPNTVTNTEEAIQAAIRSVGLSLSRFGLRQIQIRIDGRDYFPTEDNIAGTFSGVPVSLTAISPTVAGTDAGTVKADAVGRFSARFTVPTAAIGNYNVRAVGPVSDASATFAGFVRIVPPPPPPPPPAPRDPVGQTWTPTRLETVSAFSAWFTAKDAAIPITCQVRNMIGGFPGDRILAQKTLAPSEITLNVETKFSFDQYFETDAPVAFCLMTRASTYMIQTATLGKAGRNPSTWITANPYEAGVLVSSSNAQTWSVHQTSDMRFKVYGRLFTTPAVLEFASVGSVNFSDLWLGSDAMIPTGGRITWEFEQNGDAVIRPLEPFEKRRLTALATSVILRARLSTEDTHVSPEIPLGGVGLLGLLNDTTGTYISRMAEFQQDLVSAKVYVHADIPSGATVTWLVSNDDGVTWDAVSVESGYPLAVDDQWSEYGFTLSFSGSSGRRKLRVRGDFTGTALAPPRIARVGVTVA